MKTILSKKNIEQCITLAGKAISPKTPFPIISHFLLESKNNKLKVSATDLEIGIEVSIQAEIEEEGSFTVPAKTFQDIISLADGDSITLLKNENENNLEIISALSSCNIMTLNSDEFPLIPHSDDEPVFSMLQKDLRDAIKSIIFSTAAQEETRAVLTGVLIIIKENFAKFVATDGKRLAIINVPINSNVKEEISYIIPGKALSEISKSINNPEEHVYVGVKNSQIFFNMGDVLVISRLIEGNYPKFEQVIPSSSEYKIIINKNEFISSLKYILVMAQEKDFPKLIKVEFNPEKLILKSNTPDLGSAFRELTCDFKGKYIEIAFNGQYFIDVLNVIKSEYVSFEFTNDTSPGVIKPFEENISNDNYMYVVMPIVIREDI